MTGKNHFIVGVYDDPEKVLHSAKKVKSSGIRIHEVYSPFPIHGIDEVLGYKRSRLPRVAFLFGLTGTLLALVMQYWMMGIDWPMIIGGKNYASLPPFIPLTFELTVLLSALGMVGTFFVISDLKPYKKVKLFDDRITHDKHVMAINLGNNSQIQKDQIISLLKESGAEEVNEKIMEE